ncbi:TonB-dependent receptor [Sphingomonas sp. CL5.1]|uniref:TonB-dependent receptor n=1 Tax=Sphingomonas sp. CL5.1 TaxID=2653203 RepID=UPI0015815C37|nr:TonB-dependent receptor [Sphingomonas sp. CL5.1]QKR99761.1 TonB-dependent receptor [Sphingomonas sp. CL5.1]
MSNRLWLSSVAAIALASAISPAAAETAPAQPAADAQDQPATQAGTGLGDIVVTAQRRSERLQDIPLAVTAASAEDLNRARVNDVSRMQFLTPGLTWGQQGADSFPAIRGVRTQLVSAQSDPVIGYYIDGIYQSRTQQQSFPMFDVSRVEVQRGPQGTLYGRNTFGGNVSVITAEPVQRFDAGVNGSIGNYNLRQFDGFVNVPVMQDVALRVSAYHSEHDGYVKSNATPGISVNDEDQTAVRASLLAKPAPGLEISIHGAYWVRNDNGGGAYGYKVVGTLIDPATGLRSINGQPYAVNPTVHNGSAFVNGVDIGVPVTGDAWTNQWDYQPFERLKEKYVSGQISYDLGGVSLKSITGYNDFRANRSADLDQSSIVFPAPGVTAGFAGSGLQAANTRAKSFSQEFQLASTSTTAPLQWIAGAYYFHDMIDELYSQVYTAATATALGTRSRTQIDTKAYALYGQATYALIPDTLKLIAGIRYSDETKQYGITNFTAAPGSWNFATQTPALANGEAKYNKVTWRAGIEYKVAPRSLLYATVSTGFESGGINNNSSNPLIPASYAPQTVTAYEVGSKNVFDSGRIVLNISAFYNKYRDLQITILDPATNLSYYASAGAARSYGADVELKTMLLPGFHIDGTAALLNAKFTSYTRPNPFGNSTTVNLAGKDVPMSPALKTTLSSYYDIDMGNAGKLSPRVDWLFSTRYFATDYNTVLDRQGAYSIVDASLRWTDPSEKYYVEGFMNNIGNKAVIYSATLGNSARLQESFSPPRLYGLRVGARF